ncbi:MAG: hypothetical protein IIA87_00395 [Nanoarchaeota archaeon]|nr:hypothetical protein [Nanoarchaeota archaeon]
MVFNLGDLPVWFMQSYSFQRVMDQLTDLGLFDFILPFLLIFAVIFGVLSYMKMFGDNRGVNVLIALVIGLLAVRWQVYTDFLNIISPKLGIGLVILLILVILIGLFVPKGAKATVGWILVSIGFIIFLVIMAQTYEILSPGYGGGFLTEDLAGYLILVALLVGVVVAVVVGGGSKSGKSTGKKIGNMLEGLWER